MTAKKKKSHGGARKGSGPKSKGERITVHVKLRPDQHAWLSERTDSKGLSLPTMNDFVIACLAQYEGMPE